MPGHCPGGGRDHRSCTRSCCPPGAPERRPTSRHCGSRPVEGGPVPVAAGPDGGRPRSTDGHATAGSTAALSSGGAAVERAEDRPHRARIVRRAARRDPPAPGASRSPRRFVSGTRFRRASCGVRYDAVRAGRCLSLPRGGQGGLVPTLSASRGRSSCRRGSRTWSLAPAACRRGAAAGSCEPRRARSSASSARRT